MPPNVRPNLRELEGAPPRLFAWSQLNGVEITLPTTQQCLKQFIDTQVRKITIEAIQRAVAEQFGMRVLELKQKNNSRAVVVPRQIAMYLIRELTPHSYPEIGKFFSGRDHSTVMYAVQKVTDQLGKDDDLAQLLRDLKASLM